jgi:hypothetical protein
VRKAFVVASIACCAIGLAATRCSVYTTDLLGSGIPVPDGGSGLGWWSGVGDQGCYSAKFPTAASRPAVQTAPDLPPIYMAIRSMRFGAEETDGGVSTTAWEDIGFDLDNTCTISNTCAGDGGAPAVSCKPTGAGVPYDGDYCRDNTFGRLEVTASTIPELGGKYGLDDDAFNCALCVGDYNFVIKFSGYNGTAEDDHVRVDLYPSPGLDTPLPWNCQNGEWKNHPCITPDQALNIQNGITPNDGPDLSDSSIADPNAYVHEGYVVITLPANTLFAFPGKRPGVATAYPVNFTEGVVTGHFSHAQDGTWALDDGIIAGRSSAASMITGLRQIGLCEADPNYALINNFLTANLDVLSDGGNDPNALCDGLSFGIGFTAGQQAAGKIVTVAPLVECEGPDYDAGTDAGTSDSGVVDSGSDTDSGIMDAGGD